ncbi:MAG: Acetyl-CoA synthetase, partial [uncultured Frankineae bacterium]
DAADRTRGPVDREPPLRPARRARRVRQRHGGGLRAGRPGPARLLGRAGLAAAVGHPLGRGPRLAAAVRQVVRRRQAERRRQLRRPSCRRGQRRPRRPALGRGARGRHPRHHLRRAQAPGLHDRERARAARGHGRRPGVHLPADDPRGDHLDAGLRPHRRRPLGRLRRLLLAGPRRPDHRRRGQGRHHVRRRLPTRRPERAQARGRRGPPALPLRHQRHRRQADQAGRRLDRGPRPVVVRRRRRAGRAARGAGLRRRAAAVPALHLRVHRQAQGHRAHLRRLPDAGRVDALGGLRPQAGDRRLLVHRRRRLGDRPQLPHLRPARQRRDPGGVRGHARRRRPRPVVVDRREVRRDHPLHRADGHPHLHEVGRGPARVARPVDAARAGLGRRADQPRGLDVVPPRHRRRPLPDRRHLVADRDRRHHGQPAAGCDVDQAGVGDGAAARHRGRRRRRRRRLRGRDRRRLPHAVRAVAVDAARHLGRRPALPRHLLVALRGPVLRRRRGQVGRGPRPVAARARRRRHEHQRTPHLDDGGRVGPGVAPEGRRGRCRRRRGRHHRPGDRRVRDGQGRRHRRRVGRGRLRPAAAQPRRQGDRGDRQAPADRHLPRAAQDAQRQDHAAAAGRHRRAPRARRRHDARRPRGGHLDRRHDGQAGRPEL